MSDFISFAKYLKIYAHDFCFHYIAVTISYFVLQNKIIKWADLEEKKREKETIYLKMAVIDWWDTQVVKDGG